MSATPPSRPNPDELLEKIRSEETARRRGRLKVFLGYAAGVGKTHAMLEAARIRRAEGVDSVVAYVETHRRAETEALLAGMEILPRKTRAYRGVDLTEMDVDATLARRPKLALVDEFAHTNVPGSLHPKRYLDVEDLLEAGIDVYTTLNIQHIESVHDIVAQITGVKVRETVPDTVLEQADEIEVVDLPPEELLQRLREGKVYVPDQAARAVEHFFRIGNLTALREMSLRYAAERIEGQMQTYMQAKAIAGPWPAGERLMVCIRPGLFGERLVRSARRLAGELNCEWFAVYVETPEHARLSEAERDRISHTLHRAETLGGKTVTLAGSPLHRVLLDFARENNVTRILIGRPIRPPWLEWLRPSPVNRLIRESGSIDVFVTSGEPETARAAPARTPAARPQRLLRYLGSILLVGAATGLGFTVRGVISPTNLVMVYLLAVIAAAAGLGRGPSVLAAAASVLAFDYFFVPPYLTFAVADTEYLLSFLGLFAVGFVISELASNLRDQAESAERRRIEIASLYGLSRDLSAASSLETILQAITNNIAHTFDRDVVVFLPDRSRTLRPTAATPDFALGENEQAVAEWAFEHNQTAGRGTDTLPAAAARYLPLTTSGSRIGVLAVRPHDPARHLPPEGYRLLEAFANQAAAAIERVQLAERAQQARLLEATERLQSSLLNSLSHDLRTPLVSITGALTSLDEQSEVLTAEDRRSLIQTAREESERMNRLVGNLLAMTRIESGALILNRRAEVFSEVVEKAKEILGKKAAQRPIRVHVPPDFPAFPVDFALMVQMLVNLLDNAVKYSPPGSPIDIDAGEDGTTVHLEVADRGVGIPAEERTRVFDKFFRVERPENVRGSGLGLSICRGIVEAHGGRIFALPRAGGGTVIAIELPLLE
jgi:two-component system sensor histidine kinase KdpD